MKDKKNKSKKERPTYVDDGRPLADMSAFGRPRPRSTFKEQFKTYIDTVKLMIVPMFIVLGIIAAAFLLVYIIL